MRKTIPNWKVKSDLQAEELNEYLNYLEDKNVSRGEHKCSCNGNCKNCSCNKEEERK